MFDQLIADCKVSIASALELVTTNVITPYSISVVINLLASDENYGAAVSNLLHDGICSKTNTTKQFMHFVELMLLIMYVGGERFQREAVTDNDPSCTPAHCAASHGGACMLAVFLLCDHDVCGRTAMMSFHSPRGPGVHALDLALKAACTKIPAPLNDRTSRKLQLPMLLIAATPLEPVADAAGAHGGPGSYDGVWTILRRRRGKQPIIEWLRTPANVARIRRELAPLLKLASPERSQMQALASLYKERLDAGIARVHASRRIQ
jgi:hypothetical protein